MTRAVLAAMLMLAAGGCAHVDAGRCAGAPADRAPVERTIRGYYAALGADDEAAAARLASPSFYSFDGGKRYTNPQLVAELKKAHQAGTVIQWNIGPIDTHFDCHSAWAAWENSGAVGTAGALKPVKWLETAMLRRQPGGPAGEWRIEFLHSSRAQP